MWSATKNKKFGVVIYNYNGNTKCGLPLDIGDTVQILEECKGWYRGFSTRNKSLKGIFPASFVCLKAFHIDNEGLYETVTPVEDPTVREVTCALREWHAIWKKLYVSRQQSLFQRLQSVMRDLMEWRRQLVIGTFTQDQIHDLRIKVTAKIDWGNRNLGLDLVPRVDNEVVDSDALSPAELYQVHLQSSESATANVGLSTLRRRESSPRVLCHHMHLCMRDFIYGLGEEVELYFSLYDTQLAEFISERYLVKVTKLGQSNFVEKLHNHCTLFTDLGNANLKKEMYLVVHIIRIGRMLNDSKKTSVQAYRRPYGCAVLSISDYLLESSEALLEDEKEFTMKIHMCNESDFYQLHEFIIKKQSNKFNQLSGQSNYGLVISVRLLHGDLSQLQQEHPLLFKNSSLTHKRGFSEVIMPGDVRNDLYFTLERGEFEKGGKSTGKNIEATVWLVSSNGAVLEKCISMGSGHDSVTSYQSLVLYHTNCPRWSDMIKLVIPIEKFDGAHVRLEYSHCSNRDRDKKLFGYSFIPLMDSNGTILRNGLHELYVYKCEDRGKLHDPKHYLGLMWGPQDGASGVGPLPPSPPPFPGSLSTVGLFQKSPRESVFVSTLLCSTKLTQNGDVLSLLKWRDHPERIQDTLHKVMKLNGEEIVKFLQDILDALFSMFSTSDGNSTHHSGLVFKVLVHIFSLLEDSRYEHFKPVMDTYISAHFAAALVYKGLISCVKHCADLVRDAEQQESIQKCFRSLEFVFKFIIQSRLLFARATGDPNEEAFRADLFDLCSSFVNMLTPTCDPHILPTQVALVSSFCPMYEQLWKVLPRNEVCQVVRMTLDALIVANDPTIVQNQLTQAKLNCLLRLCKGELFRESDCRLDLLEVIVPHLRLHLVQAQELKLCAEILSQILSFLHHQKEQSLKASGQQDTIIRRPQRRNSTAASYATTRGINRDIDVIVTGLLEALIRSVMDIDKCSSLSLGSSSVGLLVSSLLSLYRLMEEQHYCRLWESFGERRPRRDRKQLKEFLISVFIVFRDLVRDNIYPPDWMVMRMLANHIILCALQEMSQPLTTDFLEDASFDKQLWSSYFMVAIGYLTQPALQLENFSEVKREKIAEKYGDMRVLMGFQILSMWDKLGDNKGHFIPAMVGPFLEMTLVPEMELRKATLPIFFDMMDSEQKANGNFKQVETELIDKLDMLVSENKGDDEYRQLFNTILLERVRTSEPAWKENGIAFINSITRLLERLLDYRNVMDGEENQDKRMSCTVNLLNFYKNEINRNEMYVRYIYKLCDLHLPAENFAEAAFTLKLHADLLTWSRTTLPANQRYPQQPEWRRREALYLRIIEYFDKGKCWEEGIPLCKELAQLYEKQLFDYGKLSSILKTEARFFDNILTQLRPEPEYFRVGFYGLGFPLFLRNKLFVYRGLEYERIGAFNQRLQSQFPQAQVLMRNNLPDDSILQSDGQYIQICNVKPIPEMRPEFEGQDVPDKVLSYYLINNVSMFQFDRPVHKGPVDKENEFKSLWIERTTLVTASVLPGILRWFEVTERRVEELSPIVHACESVQQMNRELRQLITHYTGDPRRSISPLSMRLQGVIEAAVNGGIAKYQEAFFTADFALQHPDQMDRIGRLKSLILEQVQILDGGLSLHGRLAPSDVQPLHRRLVDRFATMKQSIREASSPNMAARLGGRANSRTGGDLLPATPDDNRRPSIVNTPLPPIPGENIKKQSPDPGSNRSSSSGSSIYGHFLPEGSDDEDIYSRPQEFHQQQGLCFPPPAPPSRSSAGIIPPPLPNRPRSVALSSSPEGKSSASSSERSSRPSSRLMPHPPRDSSDDGYASLPCSLPRHSSLTCAAISPRVCPRSPFTPTDVHITGGDDISPASLPPSLFGAMSRMSWSEPSYNASSSASAAATATTPSGLDVAPPLPPRVCSDRKGSTPMIAQEEERPALPKRLIKKASAPAMILSPQELTIVPISLEDNPPPQSPNPSLGNVTSSAKDPLPPSLPKKAIQLSGSSHPATPTNTPVHSPLTIREHSFEQEDLPSQDGLTVLTESVEV